MKEFVLYRLADTGHETLGHMNDDEGKQFAATVEPPWRNNAHGISCIPAGKYVARRRMSAKHKCEVFEITGVPDRSDIEIHWGNTVADTEGCVVVGTAFGMFDGVRGVVNSHEAFDRFMYRTKAINEFSLEVVDAPPPHAA